MKPKFDCVKSFMDTDAFRGFSAKYGLDSEIVASFCESFATYVDLPKEKWFKYHPPIEVKVAAPIKVEEKTVTYNDPIVPTSYIEKPPFPVRITKLSVTTYFSTCREYLAENRLSFPSAPHWVRHSYLSKGLR